MAGRHRQALHGALLQRGRRRVALLQRLGRGAARAGLGRGPRAVPQLSLPAYAALLRVHRFHGASAPLEPEKAAHGVRASGLGTPRRCMMWGAVA